MASLARQTLPLVVGGEVVGVAMSTGWKGPDRREVILDRLRLALERLGRCSALYAGLHLLTQRDKSPTWVAACGAALQYAMRPFAWNLTLYFFARAVASWLRKHARSVHMRPGAIFLAHCVHNDLLVNRAELVDPSYLKLWLRMIPAYSYQSWLAQFSSTKEERYDPEQVGEERFSKIPSAVYESFRRQLPFVGALYAVPHLVFHAKTRKMHLHSASAALRFFRDQVFRVVRTSAVLALLPFILTEFPCVIDRFTREVGDTRPVRRQSLLHVVAASAASTGVFLLEPEPRLNQMMAYTYWRVLEAYIRKGTALEAGKHNDDKRENGTTQAWVASGFLGLAAAITANT